MRVFNIFVNITICATCFGRGALPLYDGRLDSDLNANNFSITNLYSLDVKNVPWVTTNQLDAAIASIDAIVESDPVAYPVATNALATATNALALAEGALQADATNGLANAVAHVARTDNPHGITAEGIGALPVRLNAYTYNVDDGYWLQLHSPGPRALLTTSTLQFFMGSTMTLGLDSDSIRINGRNYFWPAKAQDETLLTSSDIFGLASKSYVDTTFPTKSYVENTRWSADDIATNLTYSVVVSNGHWIIRETVK